MEEAFALTYMFNGINWPLEEMTAREREWMLKRMTRQKEDERAEIEKEKKRLGQGRKLLG